MNKPAVRVRPAGVEDIKVMLTLLKELCSVEKDFTFNEVRQRAGLRRLLKEPDAIVLVAERDSLIVGMCTVQTVISTAEGGLAGWLEDMVVHDKFRGQGIGQALLTAAELWAAEHKLKRLHLLVDIDNAPASEFYDATGWQKTTFTCRRKYTTTPPRVRKRRSTASNETVSPRYSMR